MDIGFYKWGDLDPRYEKRGGVGEGAVSFRPDMKIGRGGGGGVLYALGTIQKV